MSVLKITTSGTYLGAVMQNVLHFDNPDGVTTLDAAAADIRDNWAALMRNAHCSGFTYTNISVRDVSSPASQTLNLPYSAAGVGEPSAPHMVLAFILTLRGAAAGRHGRGRVYIAAPRSGWVTNSQMTAAGMSYMQTNVINPIAARFVGSGRTSNLQLCIADYGGGDPPVLTSVTSLVLRQYMGVQRRRNINVGI